MRRKSLNTIRFQNRWNRECQECGHIQVGNEPDLKRTIPTSFEFRKCQHCFSESLDLGSIYYPESED